MIQYVIIIIITLAAYLIYTLYLKPKRVRQKYVKLFKNQGYKVVELPFAPLNAPYYDEQIRSAEDKKDSFYFHKNQYYDSDVIISNLINNLHIIVIKPELIKEMISPEKAMHQAKFTELIQPFTTIAKRGLVFLEKDEWKHHRKVLSKVFNFDFIISEVPNMSVIADRIFDEFEQKYWSQNPGPKADGKLSLQLFDMMLKYTSSIIMSGFLGLDSMKQQLKGQTIQHQILKLSQMGIQYAHENVARIFGMKLIKKGWRQKDREFLALKKQTQEVLQAFIQNAKQKQKSQTKDHDNSRKKTIMELLVEQNFKENQSGQSQEISDMELIDEISTFVIAGSDTTSNYLTAMILFVFQKPEVAQKLRTQINSFILSDSDITVENMKKLQYLDCVLTETSRLFPSSGGLFDRILDEDITMFGVPINRGIFISGNWIASFHNPSVFEQPLEFIPERWEKQEFKQHQSTISLAFSGGPRGCIGKNLALTETKVMMIKFMKRYEKLFEPGREDRVLEMLLTMHIRDSQVELTKQRS